MAQILGTGKQRSAKNSRVSANGTNLFHSKWETTYEGDDLDTVNFESQGFGEGILGVIEVSISFGGDWDAGKNPFDSPPGIFPRDDFPNLKFYENVADNTFWSFTYARLRSTANSASVREKVLFNASGKSQGVFVTPTGSV